MFMKPFKTTKSEIVWSCPWYAVRRDEIVLPKGEAGIYNTITKGPAVWILPVTTKGEIVLLWQYRYTVDDWVWEIPAGSVKPKQTIEEAAREELLEEIGGEAGQLTYLGQSYMANGICDEVGHFFLATAVTLGTPAHEPAEVMQIHTKPIAEVLEMAHNGRIADAPSALVILMCQSKLQTYID